MSGAKKSVDEIWKELNARTAPPRSRTTGIPGFGIPGVSTHTRIIPKQHDVTSAQQKHVAGDISIDRQALKPTVTYDPTAAGVTHEELQQVMSTLQRTLNCLTDPDRSVRKTAATSLQNKLLRGDAATPKASPSMLQALLAGPLLHPLMTLLLDPLERCRLTALQLLLEAVPQITDPGALLPGLLPQMVDRMGKVPVQEPAEEVRLAGLQLLEAIISRTPASVLVPMVEDICQLLARGFEDSYPDAKKEAASVLVLLASRLPAGSMESQAEKLMQSILPCLSHQHSKVRLALLSGLRSLVLSGVPAGLLQKDAVPALKPLAFDRAAAVREAFYAAVASWLGCHNQQQQQQNGATHSTMPEGNAGTAIRCQTYAPALLPLLLLGVSDEQQHIATAALAAVEEVGAAWMQQQQQLIDHPAAAGVGTAEAMDIDGQQSSTTTAGDSSRPEKDCAVADAAVTAAQLPTPFTGLPGTGCRCMVSALLPKLLPDILAGLKEWTSTLRSAAARTLHTCLILAGPAVTPYLQQLLAALAAAMADEDADIIKVLVLCCRTVGALVPCNSWLPLVVDLVSDSKAGAASKANALVVTTCLVNAAAVAQQQPDQQLLQMLVAALAADDIRCCDHLGVQNQLLGCVANLLSWLPAAAAEAAGQQIYLILLQLHGVAAADAPAAEAPLVAQQQQQQPTVISRGMVAQVMQLLAMKLQSSGVNNLSAAYAQQLLPQLTADSDSWTAGSSNLQAFMSLLQTAGASCLAEMMPTVIQVIQPILSDHDRDAALRLALLKLLDDLMEDQATATAFGGPNAEAVMQSLLMPPLIWRAGKSAAAVRFQAITALCSLISNKLLAAEALLAATTPSVGLLPLLAQCLDEDWYSDVRHTACYVVQLLLEQVGSELIDEARRSIYPELLKRLDDSSNKVRIAACAALVAFIESAGSSYCSTNSGYLAAGVVLHMDDGDQAVAEAACKVMQAMALTKPEAAVAEVNKVKDRFRAKHLCERVLATAAAASADAGPR